MTEASRPGSRLLEVPASWRRVLTVAIVTAAIVGAGGVLVTRAGLWEMPLAEALNRMHSGVVGVLGDLLYKWVGPVPAIVATAILAVVLTVVSRDWRVTTTFVVTLAVTWLSLAVIKDLVARPRPDKALLAFPHHHLQHDASYPSGHAGFLTILAVLLVSLLRSRRARIVAGTIATVLVAGALLLLTIDAVHYPTDVIASALWCVGVGPLVRVVWVRLVLPRIPVPGARRVREQGPAARVV